MAFCTLSNEFNRTGFTLVDNLFITQFMSGAPEHCIEVYLYGLTLCREHESGNNIEIMSRALNLAREDILDAFAYWEELGIIHVTTGAEPEVIYLPIKADTTILRKVKSGKYSDFATHIQAVISRMITPNEFNEYFVFLETTNFEPEALVFVAKYCAALKGDSINYRYILTVARNLVSEGLKSLSAVEERLQEHYNYNEDLALLFKNMHLKRTAEYSDKEKYERWTKKLGFTFDTLLGVTKLCKVNNMEKLDSLLEEFYSMNLMSIKEITDYTDKKNTLLDLAKDINKAIGVYYQSLDSVVTEYTAPWINKGFSSDTLLLIARYCFKNSVRTLQGMNGIVEKFFKLGLTSAESINQYLERVIRQDAQIREILEKAGIVRNVTAQDRAFFRTWTEKWNMPIEVILYLAELSATANNPVTYLNKVLSDYYNRGVDSLEQIKKSAATKKDTKTTATKTNKLERNYTDSELQALFANLDEVEV